MSGLDQALSARLGVPVIDAVAAAVVWAEALVQPGVSTSKAMTYRPPEIKPILGYPAHMQPDKFKRIHRVKRIICVICVICVICGVKTERTYENID